jgi:hypothetical protein
MSTSKPRDRILAHRTLPSGERLIVLEVERHWIVGRTRPGESPDAFAISGREAAEELADLLRGAARSRRTPRKPRPRRGPLGRCGGRRRGVR